VVNVVPTAYRQVSVAKVDVALTEQNLQQLFLGRECYRRTRYVVMHHGDDTALIEVTLQGTEALFSPAVAVRLLAGAQDTVYVRDPDIDTAIPSQLAQTALRHPTARAVIVEGRYGHVSFILDPAPIRIRVREVVPPYPAKLLDQALRVLDVAEDLPPIVLEPDPIELTSLAPEHGAVLLPCQGSGIELAGRDVWFLDQRPDRRDWTLLGCARSREIHRWFYGDDAACVDTCPRTAGADDALTLTKCCLLEAEIEVRQRAAVVPWGASMAQVREALHTLARMSEPAWAPG